MMSFQRYHNNCCKQKREIICCYILQAAFPKTERFHTSSFPCKYRNQWKLLATTYLTNSIRYNSLRCCSTKGKDGSFLPETHHHRLERATRRLLDASIGSLTAGHLEELSTAISYWSTDRRNDCNSYMMIEALRCRLFQEEKYIGQSLLTTCICQSIMEGWIKCSVYSTRHINEPHHTTVLKMQQLLDHILEQYRSGNMRMKPNDFVFSLVMDGWADLCDIKYVDLWKNDPFYPAKQVQNLLSLMEDVYEIDERKPTTACYNIAIKAWAKSANKVDVKSTLEVPAAAKAESILMKMLEWYRLEKDPCTTMRAPDTKTFNTVMHAWAESVHLENYATKAEHILNLMTSFSEEQHQLLKHPKSYSNHRHTSSFILVKPDKVSYSTVISAYATSPVSGAHLKAQQLLSIMEDLSAADSNLCPNTYTYNAVIKAIAKSGCSDAPFQAEALLLRMLKMFQDGHSNSEMVPDIFSYNTVIHGWASSNYAKASERAEELLRQMQCLSREKHSSVSIRPDIVSYNTVCDAIAKSRKKDSAEKIIHLIEEMQQCSIHPDTTTYNTLLSAYVRSGSKNSSVHAESVLSNMKSLYERGNDKVKPDLFTYNQILDAYAKCTTHYTPRKAIKLINEMQNMFGVESDIVTFGSAIAACGNSGSPTSGFEAEKLLAMMIAKYKEGEVHLKPNTFCFNGVINAHVKSGDKNAVMHAESIFRRMQECDVKPNNVSFSLMIHAYTKSGQQGSWKRAEALLEEMHACYNVAPDVVTFNTVLWAIANSGEPDAAERAEKMLIQMIHRKLSNKASVTPDTISFASVINAWAYTSRYNLGIAEGAWRVLQQQLELMDSGFSDSLRPTIHHFNEVLKACCYTKGTQEVKVKALSVAAQVFDYVQGSGSNDTTNNVSCKANHTTYALFIRAGVRQLDRECDANKKRNLVKYAFRTCLENANSSDVSIESVLKQLQQSSFPKSTSDQRSSYNEYFQSLLEEVRSEMR